MPVPQPRPALFARLVGASWESLPAPLREVHEAEGRIAWRGRCRVRRGAGFLARLAGHVMDLPPPGEHPDIEVVIEASRGGETWTRCIGGTRMRSRLRDSRGRLVEAMGPCVFAFALDAANGAIHWRLHGVRCLGLPLPPSWFRVEARESVAESLYRFEVRAAVAGVGLLVAYDGTLEGRR
jgi:hypothetical protein